MHAPHMNDFNRANPSVLGFRLVSPSPITACDACGTLGWQAHAMFACGSLYACSAECAAELGHAVDREAAPKADRAARLRSHRCDVVTVFRAAGLV